MRFPSTLSSYFARQFLFAVIAALAGLTGLGSLFDLIDLLRRAASRPKATFGLVSEMAALRLPWLMMQILPFAVLLGGIYAFWRLTRSSELVVARAAGVSIWQILGAPFLVALSIGALATAVISPISSVTYARATALDNAYLRVGAGPLSLNGGQLWLRQSDNGLIPDGVAIIHAAGVSVHGRVLRARQVSVFRLGRQDRLLERIQARQGTLLPGAWLFTGARTLEPGHLPSPPGTVQMPTDLTIARVQESFASPDALSVWELPGFIGLLARSGFSTVAHRLYFQTLLALPLLCGTMSLVAAGFSMRPARRGRVSEMLLSGAAAGFALFIISKVAAEYGKSGALPPLLAAWAPAAAGLMLALALLLHLEDG
ncbi:MAG: LPS export ABC transporter permease LptG [Rhodospirillales bacterium]|nr:LPS export ABC transporter permease LptG [Rhodospirillales bacterium]